MHELTRLIVRLFKFVRPKRSDTNFATSSETTLPEKEKEEKSLVETYPFFLVRKVEKKQILAETVKICVTLVL